WIFPAERIETFVHQVGIVFEGQLDGPVVGKVETAPLAVVIGKCAGGHEVSRLLEIAPGGAAVAEVLAGIIGVSEMKPPAKVEEQALAAGAGSRRGELAVVRKRAGILRKRRHRCVERIDCLGSGYGRRRQQAGFENIATGRQGASSGWPAVRPPILECSES